MGGGWSTPCPGHFNPRKETQHPLYRRLSGYQGCSERAEKILPTPGINPQTIQPTASIYTNHTIPAHPKSVIFYKTQSRSGTGNGTHFNCRLYVCSPCGVVGHHTNSPVKSRVNLTDDGEIPLKWMRAIFPHQNDIFCLVVGYVSIGSTVAVLDILWWLSLPEALHLLLQLLPSGRPADLDICHIRWMYVSN
jgi:hypothetical protein